MALDNNSSPSASSLRSHKWHEAGHRSSMSLRSSPSLQVRVA